MDKYCPFVKEDCHRERCQLWVEINNGTNFNCVFVKIAAELMGVNFKLGEAVTMAVEYGKSPA